MTMTSSCTATSQESSHNFCLKWSNYQSHVLSVLVQLLQSETMVDVTLCAAGGEKVCAHRIILCAASSYFQEILACSEDSHPVVILGDVSAEDMRCILEFVYHGELNVDASQLTSVLQVAASLQIKGLMEVSEQLPTLIPLEENSMHFSEEEAIVTPCTELSKSDSIPSASTKDPDPQSSSSDPAVPHPQKLECTDVSCSTTTLQTETFTENNLNEGEPIETINNGSLRGPKGMLQFVLQDKKRRKRRENCRRDYSEEQLAAALNDLSSGHMLVETATAHCIPRSTLYTRAKAAGISLAASRQEHSGERVQAAVEAVTNGSSLQQASLLYQIPKTVLWRRVRAAGGREGWIPRRSPSYGLAHRQAAIQALQSGQNLSKVSAEFQIPKTTLFREKIRLVEAGKLPWSSLKKRDPHLCALKHSRIKEAVAACKEGKMSQAAASVTYQVPKTTIWRRLKKCGPSSCANDQQVQSTDVSHDSSAATARLQEQAPFSFCESNSQLPVTYIVADTDFPDTALII